MRKGRRSKDYYWRARVDAHDEIELRDIADSIGVNASDLIRNIIREALDINTGEQLKDKYGFKREVVRDPKTQRFARKEETEEERQRIAEIRMENVYKNLIGKECSVLIKKKERFEIEVVKIEGVEKDDKGRFLYVYNSSRKMLCNTFRSRIVDGWGIPVTDEGLKAFIRTYRSGKDLVRYPKVKNVGNHSKYNTFVNGKGSLVEVQKLFRNGFLTQGECVAFVNILNKLNEMGIHSNFKKTEGISKEERESRLRIGKDILKMFKKRGR